MPETASSARVEAPDELSPMGELLWNLREWGYPITKQSVIYVVDYLEDRDAKPEEVNYQTVAQSIAQNTELDFETNNEVSAREFLESQGVDTDDLSNKGVQLALEDFTRGSNYV